MLQFTPYTLPLIIAALIALVLCVFTLRYRNVPGRVTFALLMAGVAVWAGGYALEISAIDPQVKVFWAKVQYFGIAVVPLLWLRFVVHFVGESAWLTPLRFSLLAVGPALTVGFVMLNRTFVGPAEVEAPGLQLFWRQITLDESLGFPMLEFGYGPGLWAYAGYSYLLLLIGALMLFRAIVRLPRLGVRQATVMLMAVLAPWVGNALYLTGANPFPLLDLTPFSFTVTGLAVAWGMGRFRFMGTIPVAHRAIIAGMRDGVVALDTENYIAELNPAAERLFGLRPDDVLGRPATAVFQYHPEVVRLLQTKAESRHQSVLRVGGQEREFDISILLLYDRRRHAGRLVTFHDVSKLVLAEREMEAAKELAERANQSKSEFLANVSHEIRTPLSAILGMTGLTLEGELGDKERQYLEVVKSSADSLLRIINDILDFSKIEARKLVLDNVGFDLRKVLGDTMTMLGVTAADKNLDLSCDIADDVPEVIVGDPFRLRQVLINLVSNAIKFTDEGEVGVRITLADVQPPAATAVAFHFMVQDTGIGIGEEDKQSIFDSFAQADASTTRIYGGTGLGLSIARHLIGLMGGEIELESEVGKGSAFHFDAIFERPGADVEVVEPVAPAIAVATPEHVVAAATPSEDALRILVADDNVINQRMIRLLLESRGHDVTVVGDGQEVLEALGNGDFDLVLMDVQMPNVDGLKATKSIRSGEQWTGRHIPIIAVTAHAMAGDRERFLAAGMDDYLAKPLDAKALFKTLERLAGEAPPASSAPPVETRNVAAIDPDALLSNLGGDEELLVEIIDLFVDDCPKVMDAIRGAVADGDAEAVCQAAHRLKGSVGSLSAAPAFEAARHLEDVGRGGEMAAAPAALAALENEIERLRVELETLRGTA